MQQRIHKILLATLAFGLFPASASIVDIADVSFGGNTYRAYQDTTSLHVWLDLDNFLAYNGHPYTYNTLDAVLAGSGFHIATWSEIQALDTSMREGDPSWLSLAAIIGANYPGNPNTVGDRSLMWGILNNLGSGVDYALRWDGQPGIGYAFSGFSRDIVFSDLNSTSRDLGAWVVSDNAVPEPGTFLLLGAGLGLIAMRRHREAGKPRLLLCVAPVRTHAGFGNQRHQ